MKNEKSNHAILRMVNIDEKHIEDYLSGVKRKILGGKYHIVLNDKRQDNINLFFDYVIDKSKEKEILLKLSPRDFSDILPNEHEGYEDERLYVFGKDVTLTERIGKNRVTVPLYIKINNLENGPVIIISFHKQKHPLTYYFSRR